MANSPSPPARQDDMIEGLDPRALFAQAQDDFARSMRMSAWRPPSAEELSTSLPGYEVRRLIGRGGMGAVFEARDVKTDRVVAIKLLPAEISAADDAARRFREESSTLAKLSHPRIVAILDAGQTLEGQPYFVMEYLAGGDLASVRMTRGLSPEEAIAVASRVCDALEFAHAEGIVHRDIKPANVLLDGEGHVKIGDFGLAKWFGDEAGTKLTVTGASVGTPDYIAPEQFAGLDADPRSDIFSVGVLLYEMLTGRTPRGAWEAPSQIAGVDARVDAIVTMALQPDPARRFQSAAAMGRALREMEGQAVAPGGNTKRGRRALLGLGVIVLSGSFFALFVRPRPADTPHAPPLFPAPPVATKEQPFADLWQRLDLQAATIEGAWRWSKGPGSRALIESGQPTAAKRFELPAHVGIAAYKLSFTLLRRDAESDVGVVLTTGRTKTGLILFLNGSSGLGMVSGRRWDGNETTRADTILAGPPMHVEITVRPEGENVSIEMTLDGKPYIRWSGPQRELSLFEDPRYGWKLRDAEALGFCTYRGGIGIAEVQVELLP